MAILRVERGQNDLSHREGQLTSAPDARQPNSELANRQNPLLYTLVSSCHHLVQNAREPSFPLESQADYRRLVVRPFHLIRGCSGDQHWDPQFGPVGANDTLQALAVSGQQVFVGGNLTAAGNTGRILWLDTTALAGTP